MSIIKPLEAWVLEGNDRLSEIRSTLGEPAFEGKGVLIYRADSLAAMDQLASGLIDLTVTSPPYNIGKEYETRLPLVEYLDWMSSWIQQVYRLTSSHGAFWLNLGYTDVPTRGRAVPIPYLLWDRVPFFLLQEVVWNYGAGVATKRTFSPRNEKFLWFVKSEHEYTFNLDDVRDPDVKYPNQKKNGKLRVHPKGKNPSDVWQFPKVTTGEGVSGRRASKERTAHPAQFPEAVVKRIIQACSRPGDLIMDPFLGSGTTASVAIAHGRPIVGFEINPQYVNMAVNRINRLIA